nr:hypothetical protein GOBAR_AA05421 [Ipomoea batatas]
MLEGTSPRLGEEDSRRGDGVATARRHEEDSGEGHWSERVRGRDAESRTEQSRALGHGSHPGRDSCKGFPKKKSVAQRQPAAPQVPDTPLHDPKNFERFQFFFGRQIFKPYVLSLDVAAHFGIRDEVADLVELLEWKYLLMEFEEDTHQSLLVEVMTIMKLPKFDGLTSSVCVQFHIGHTMFRFSPNRLSDLMGFSLVQQLTEEEKFDRVANVPNVQEFWEELIDGTTVFKSSHSRSSEFRKKEHKFMQYLLGHSITGRFDATSSVNHADLLCLYGMVKRVQLHMGVVIWNLMKNQYYLRGVALYLGPYFTRILRATQQIVLTKPRAPGMQPLTAEAVARMGEKIGPKRARTVDMADVTDARREEEAYEAYPDAVLAQLAAMNMRFDHIDNRLDEMAAANAHSRAEAQAYYEWMRGHYPPPGALRSHLMIPLPWDDLLAAVFVGSGKPGRRWHDRDTSIFFRDRERLGAREEDGSFGSWRALISGGIVIGGLPLFPAFLFFMTAKWQKVHRATTREDYGDNGELPPPLRSLFSLNVSQEPPSPTSLRLLSGDLWVVTAATEQSVNFPSPFLAEQMAVAAALLPSTVAGERTKQSEARKWRGGAEQRAASAEHPSPLGESKV